MKRVLGGSAVLSLAIALGLGSGLSTIQTARGDEVYGKIRGVATDAAGAAVVGAEIVATNADTGISKSVTSQSNGEYEFVQLAAPGNYSISAQQKGFKTFRANAIHLDLGQIYLLNVHFEVGSLSESIVVEANQTQVETTSMQLGLNIDSNTIVNLPLNGRNWILLQ
jgi:hypothetical protein